MIRAGVVGWPVSHSRSPLLHGFWLSQYGIDGSYEAIAVKPEELEQRLLQLAAEGYAGVNVTVPHKEAAFALAVTLGVADDVAQRIGAVNTLRFEGGKITLATNTDCTGFIANLKAGAPQWEPAKTRALVIGAGGAARGVIIGLIDAGVRSIEILNRTREKAVALADALSAEPCEILVGEWENPGASMACANLLVNTTSLGMRGEPPLNIDPTGLPEGAIVTDIVYAPLETNLLKNARARGLTAVDGLGMLLHQAVPGFEMWFGKRPEVTPALRTHVLSDGK